MVGRKDELDNIKHQLDISFELDNIKMSEELIQKTLLKIKETNTILIEDVTTSSSNQEENSWMDTNIIDLKEDRIDVVLDVDVRLGDEMNPDEYKILENQMEHRKGITSHNTFNKVLSFIQRKGRIIGTCAAAILLVCLGGG